MTSPGESALARDSVDGDSVDGDVTSPAPACARRILIVDDNSELVTLMIIQLAAAGFDVATAGNAADAIASATATKPDLAILDIRLEGGSGLELARLLRDQLQIPFLFLSVLEDASTVRTATEMGALAYLVKPQDLRQLIPMVTAALARADELEKLRKAETNLENALHSSRTTNIAIGVVMERYRTSRASAFMMLRDHARSTRRSLDDTAAELVNAAEALNRYPNPPMDVPRGKKPTR